MIETAVRLCKEAEGFSPKVYKCPAGYKTIGYGRNLETNPLNSEELKLCYVLNGLLVISEEIADKWLREDIAKILDRIASKSWFKGNAPQKAVLIDLVYNMGLSKLLTFKKFIKAMEDENFIEAVKELKDSRWYRQVGLRSVRNCEILRTGIDDYDYYGKRYRLLRV